MIFIYIIHQLKYMQSGNDLTRSCETMNENERLKSIVEILSGGIYEYLKTNGYLKQIKPA